MERLGNYKQLGWDVYRELEPTECRQKVGCWNKSIDKKHFERDFETVKHLLFLNITIFNALATHEQILKIQLSHCRLLNLRYSGLNVFTTCR